MPHGAQLHEQPSFGAYTNKVIIAGAIGGVLSAIPGLNYLNTCFCLLVIGGVGAGMHMWFAENPGYGMKDAMAAQFGGVAGIMAGFIASVLGFGMTFVGFGFGNPLGGFIGGWWAGAWIVLFFIGFMIMVVGCALFGALGGFLAMQTVFKDKRIA